MKIFETSIRFSYDLNYYHLKLSLELGYNNNK